MPLIPFARAGHVCAGREGVQRMRSTLLDSFRMDDGLSTDPGQYSAATELLLIALGHHPSLVDMMLFPAGLQGSPEEVSLPMVQSQKCCRRQGCSSTILSCRPSPFPS